MSSILAERRFENVLSFDLMSSQSCKDLPRYFKVKRNEPKQPVDQICGLVSVIFEYTPRSRNQSFPRKKNQSAKSNLPRRSAA